MSEGEGVKRIRMMYFLKAALHDYFIVNICSALPRLTTNILLFMNRYFIGDVCMPEPRLKTPFPHCLRCSSHH